MKNSNEIFWSKYYTTTKRIYIINFVLILCMVVIVGMYVRVTGRIFHIINCMDKGNTGDMVSSAGNYFWFPNPEYHNIGSVNFAIIKPNDFVIFSGGGLIDQNNHWNRTIKKLCASNRYCYAWGIGFNKHRTAQKERCQIDLTRFRRAGIRDVGTQTKHLPCSSCMLKQFDEPYTIKRDIGVLEHVHFPIKLNGSFDTIKNNRPIDEIIRFIGESKRIVTNTYHCLYFATLSEKPVVLHARFSNKFDRMPFPIVDYSGDLEKDFEKHQGIPNYLRECRRKNKRFYHSVMLDCMFRFP